ncbi:G-D-S-L family lipolytic protein [Polaribacter porphyrae]|uniref:G-D-S-L family lipolytic protein n=1 Tax=Polaribacter porphyrae TaxID=1137780 RepID=A0A2S7WS76_9FLAO|nr:G-D-S-L family lipolytic protein [Polaribacter porphyrae]PQJ80172.1 G-D-S-L family lipolytic protein [Polaribacter porphyrae]
MKNYKYIALFLLSIGGFMSCDVNNELDPITEEAEPVVQLNTNGLDFSKYVAIGASFTSGFTDGALFIKAQENSFPSILASKFGTSFASPLMNDNIGGFVLGSTVVQPPRFYFNGAGPARLNAVPTTQVTARASGTSFNNYGIPGAKSFHLTFPGYATLNPYFGRMASAPNATVMGDALTQAPTFFTLSEIGGNDVLGFALSGGAGVDQTGNLNPATYGSNDITDPNVFAQVFSGMVTALTTNGAKGVVANVPYITSLANFTTVPFNSIPMDAATAAQVNAGYAPYNGGLQQALAALAGTGLLTQAEVDRRTINFTAGQNAVVIIDEDLTDLGAINPAFAALPKYRQATADDLLLLASSSFLGTTVGGNPALINGVSVPLADMWVLTPEEQTAIKTATDAYNTTIQQVASANPNITMVDFKTVLQTASTTGIMFDGNLMTTGLVTGGLISLDGVHLTGRGYALMANEILGAIDTEFGSNFSVATDGLAKAENYPTNYNPSLR